MDQAAVVAEVLASASGRRAVEANQPGTLIRLVREALGWRQCELAVRSGYSQPTISRLEQGRGRIMDVTVRAQLAEVLSIPRSAVGLAASAHDVPLGRSVGDMRRSDLLRGVLAAAVAVAMPREIGSTEPQRLGMSVVRKCRASLDRLYELDEQHGGATIYALATRMVEQLQTSLSRATYAQNVGRELRAVAASTAEHAGWLAFDAGRLTDARRWWLEALHLADLAGVNDIRITALSSMALQASVTPDPANGREAVDLMDAARRIAGTKPTPRLMSLLSARQAIGYARIGDRNAAIRSLTSSERAIGDGQPLPDEPTWLHFWGPADLACHRARAFLALGEVDLAQRAAAEAIRACDPSRYPRNHTIYAAVRATALVSGGRVDEAISAATPVVARVSTLGSRRIVAETATVIRALAQRPDYRPAASFTAWARQLLPAA